MKLFWRTLLGVGFCIQLFGFAQSGAATPATFKDREREGVIGETFSPLNPSGSVSGITASIQTDPALARVLRPNTFCRNSSGNLIPNCGVSAGNETADWSGGVKKRDINIMSPNGLRADLIQSAVVGNQFPMLLSSAAAQTATTYSYADSGALAGMLAGVTYADGALAGYKLALDSLNAQAARDPIVGDIAAQKFNGCMQKELNGNSNGNQAQALSICLGDRSVSAGNFVASSGPGATLGDVPDHAPTGGLSINSPPSMPDNQHSVWAEIFNPLIYAAPVAAMGNQATKADFISLLADARRLTGDVLYTETVSGTGNTRIQIQRQRNANPSDDPTEMYRQTLRLAWNSLNILMGKMCDYVDQKYNIDWNSHDPFPWVALGTGGGFWDALQTSGSGSSLTHLTQADLIDLSFQSFQFRPVGGDLLFAAFLKSQEHKTPASTTTQDPKTGKGRRLDCDELDPMSGQKAQFEKLLESTSGNFNTKKLKQWRQHFADVSIRIALGQWLGRLRSLKDFLSSTAGGVVGGRSLIVSSLAEQMILETAGVASAEQLELSYRNNREELRATFERIQATYAAELSAGSGTISDMFMDARETGSADTALSGPST